MKWKDEIWLSNGIKIFLFRFNQNMARMTILVFGYGSRLFGHKFTKSLSILKVFISFDRTNQEQSNDTKISYFDLYPG